MKSVEVTVTAKSTVFWVEQDFETPEEWEEFRKGMMEDKKFRKSVIEDNRQEFTENIDFPEVSDYEIKEGEWNDK